MYPSYLNKYLSKATEYYWSIFKKFTVSVSILFCGMNIWAKQRNITGPSLRNSQSMYPSYLNKYLNKATKYYWSIFKKFTVSVSIIFCGMNIWAKQRNITGPSLRNSQSMYPSYLNKYLNKATEYYWSIFKKFTVSVSILFCGMNIWAKQQNITGPSLRNSRSAYPSYLNKYLNDATEYYWSIFKKFTVSISILFCGMNI